MTENYSKIYLYKRIVQAKLFIDAHYSENIDLNNIADEAYFSKFHFIRLFRTAYGRTPHQYLTRVRIYKAEELLRAGTPVAEVCAAVGFASIGSFTTLFKRYKGIPPFEYRQHYQRRQEQIKTVPLQFVPNCFAEKSGWVQKSNFEEVC